MKMVKGLVHMIGLLFFLAIGIGLIVLGLNIIEYRTIYQWVDVIYAEPQIQLALVLTGLVEIVIVLIYMQIQSAKELRERTIAFDNPDGQVKISLLAIEDFIKKIAGSIVEVKELRPKIIAHKKGVDVQAKVVLFSDTNIPEITERIQSTIRTRVQEMLGIEEKIQVKLFVSSISRKDVKPKSKDRKESADAADDPRIPFTVD